MTGPRSAPGRRDSGGTATSGSGRIVACLDVGSTFTKGVAVSLPDGAVLATAEHITTLPPADAMDGVDAVLADLTGTAGPVAEVRAASSAGGGLRLAVVGYERAVTAEAGARVALSAGATVVHVHAGPLDPPGERDLRAAAADVVLLVGGTDGGNADVLVHNASRLAAMRMAAPVVVAGNADAAPGALDALRRTRRRVVAAPNVLPRIGTLEPLGARAAIREAFLRHVIGGKGLSRRGMARLVRGATPDVVLAGVEALADAPGSGDVLVVDVGGATTDVYSVVTPVGEDAALHREVVAPMWRARTVEGDLGLRVGAPGVVTAAHAERLLEGAATERLAAAARLRAGHPAWLPVTPDDERDEADLARLAVTVALRRHARPPTPSSPGRDLRRVTVVVGSGGVLRHGDAARRAAVLAPATGDHTGGWRLPERPLVTVDRRSVLLAAGLLAPDEPAAAARVARQVLAAERG